MNFKQLTSNSAIDKLLITEKQILHIIPDFDYKLSDVITNIPINHNLIQQVVVKSGMFKLGRKILNPKEYYMNSKQLLMDNHLKISSQLPKDVTESKYVVIDHSIASEAVKFIHDTTSEKAALFYLLQHLKKEVSAIKKSHPTTVQNILFDLRLPENGLADVLMNLTKLTPENLNTEYKIFDDWILVSANAADKTIISPIMGYNNGRVEFYKSKLIRAKSNVELNTDTVLNVSLDEPKDTKSSKITNDIIVDDTLKKEVIKVDDETLDTRIYIDRRKLSNILKRYKIKDPILANNVKLAVDKYVNSSSDEQLKAEHLEITVLKAINKSIFNTDTLSEEYIADPNKLFSKLSQVNVYSEEIEFPKPNNQAIAASDVINLKTITGPVRHKFEFSENLDFAMETMFKSLQKIKNNPITVLNIHREKKDNNLNRYFKYTITLQNQTGGSNEPYDITINIPALVNDKYFKLGGNEYILVSQQYLHPLTKDKDNEVRFLTHYNMTRLSVQNLKFNVSQVNEIINYVHLKYSELVSSIKKDSNNNIYSIVFKDNAVIDLTSTTPFESETEKLEYIDGLYYVIKKTDSKIPPLKIGNEKNEYIYKQILKQITKVNPNDKLNKSQRTIPYIRIHIIGQKIPFILFVAQKIGLLNALTKFEIDYDIGETAERPEPTLTILLDNNVNLYIYTKTLRQELIANGLIYNHMAKEFTSISADDLNKKDTFDELFSQLYGTNVVKKIDETHEKSIDPTTAELLTFYDYPDNYLDVLSGPALEKLLNAPVDHGADLTHLRVRQSEIFTNILYDQLQMAVSAYSNNVGLDPDAKLRFEEDYLIYNLMGKHSHAKADGGNLLELATPYSPYAELTLASKVSKSGKGGIPNSRMLKKQMRIVHESYMGNIGANAFGESNPGATNIHTLGVSISNQYGTYGSKQNTDNVETNNMDSLSICEALTPLTKKRHSIVI